MAKITFEEIMARYGGNKTAYAGLKDSCKKNKTVPFVGAGLCVPFGYKQWSGLLKELATLLTDEKRKTKVSTMIDLGELLEAAQEIHDHAGDLMFDALQQLVSIDIYKQSDSSVRQNSAVMLLPELFPITPVITTNFDQVLEHVYTEVSGDYLNKCTPFDLPQLTQLSQKNAHILLKLHGDIGSGICSTDKLVFTKKQYEDVYAPEAPITEALSNLFRNNSMLFLGASLEQDRTTDILEAVHEKYPDTRHYAILSYPEAESELKETLERLGRLGVLPIFFPTKQYGAIRVILEELLGKNSPNPCAKPPQQNHSTVDKSPAARLAYDSDCVDFVGRAKELSLLEEFCQKGDHILWWAVTAPGGMGKSRLVYEFVLKMKDKGWEYLWLKKEECGSLSDLRLPPGDCILVTDDVQGYFHDLKKYLPAILEQHRDGKLRILLLERDGKDLMSSSWGEMVVRDPYDNPLEDYAYSQEFLQLKPLSTQDLTAIMTNYAEKLGHPIASDKVADKLLKALTNVDKELLRPLYAQVIADAWCNGDPPTKWTRNQLLDKLLKRELSFFYNRLHSILGKQPTKRQCKSLELLLAYSCVLEPLLLDDMEQTLYAGLCPDDMELSDFLEYLGVVRKVIFTECLRSDEGEIKIVETTQTKAVILDCPDLVKEYLVIHKAFVENGWSEILLPVGWERDPRRLSIIRGLLHNYPDRMSIEHSFWDKFWTATPDVGLPTIEYLKTATLARNLTKIQKLDIPPAIFHNKEHLAQSAAIVFAEFSSPRDLVRYEQIITHLESLHVKYQHDEVIAAQYAKCLSSFCTTQGLQGAKSTVNKLSDLYKNFKNCETIAVAYSRGLRRLVEDDEAQNVQDQAVSINTLAELYERFEKCEEIAEDLSRSYCMFSFNCNLAGRKLIVERLATLYEQWHNQALALAYISGLLSLSFEEVAENSLHQVLFQAQSIAESYPNNPYMQDFYVHIWFNLTLVQTGEARSQTIQALRKYLETHPEANQHFQSQLDDYLSNHPDQDLLYAPLRI